MRYLPAHLHNRPERIAPAVEGVLDSISGERPVFVAYADCGTGGLLDAALARHPGVDRLPGAHCYEVFAGSDRFAALHEEEPGTFFLTDFLARHFDALVWQGLGLDRHPQLRDMYFANYRRVVLLSQSDDPDVVAAGRRAAEALGLAFDHRHVGRGGLAVAVPVEVARMSRRRGGDGEVVVILWRDIPAQVNGQVGRDRHQVLLSEKFQRAVDRAKRKAKIHTAQEDVAQWRREARPADGDVAAAAQAEADRLEASYSEERLGKLAFAGGWEQDVGGEAAPTEGAPARRAAMGCGGAAPTGVEGARP